MPFRRRSKPAAANDRLRKRLLSGAVEDNLRAIRNEPAGQLHRRPPIPWRVVGAVALSLAGAAALWLALGAPALLRSRGSRGPSAAERSAADAAALAAAAPAAASAPVRVPGRVFPLSVHHVVIDPGHGGGDVGTRTPTGVYEKDLTLDIARRLARLLDHEGFEVELTREGDSRVSLRDRARAANEHRADLFVSIHVNWLEDGRANRGIETYFLGPSDDPFITELASAENRESGYSIADVRRLLDSIYADLRQEQSRALAAEVQHRLLRSMREIEPEVADRGVKSAPFLVLVATEMPAILAEVASLSSDDEARLLAEEGYRERIAVALFEGIRSYSARVAAPAPATEVR
jgi:N-acetylmuramoyl-L-alanine amidase